MTQSELEQRLSDLEQDVRQLKQLVVRSSSADWRSTFGAFADDAEFDEIVRLGREYRERQRDAEAE